MGFFDNKQRWVSRQSVRQGLRTSPSRFPGGKGRKFERKERMEWEGDLMPGRAQNYLSREQYQRKIKDLERSMYKSRSAKDRYEIRSRIDHLRKLGGL